MSDDELVAALSNPSFYPHNPADVELIETHISWVFMAGKRVYKVKKEISFPFLDYSTLARRKMMCEREVQVNKGLAPRLYRGVVGISRGPGGLSLGTDGEVVAWAVEMNRLPEHRMFHRLLADGVIDNLALSRIAETVSHFHARCETGPGVNEHASLDVIAGNVADNFRDTEDHIGACLSATLWKHLKEWFEEQLRVLAPTFRARLADGRARAGHGDLRAEHLCLHENGTVEAFDGIEFNDDLRCCDVASEIAFLCMDIQSFGFHHFARYLALTYARLAGDTSLMEVLPFYIAYRAHVRAKVDGLRMSQLPPGPEREAARLRAAQHYHLAYMATRTAPMVILTYGLAGSGKSTLAREVSRTLGLHWIRSDTVHKRLQGVRPSERLKTGFLSGAYTQEAKQRTYVELLKLTASFVERGEGVIVDASFGYPYMRDPFMARIADDQWDHLMMVVQVGDEESKRRLDARAAEATDASDATYEIYLKQKEAFVAPEEVERRIILDGTLPTQDQLARLIDAFISG